MASAIEQKAGLTCGHAALGRHGNTRGTVPQQVHDGDTIIAEADGNLGVRFLGVDAAEISLQLPGEKQFSPLGSPKWQAFLSDPFASHLPPFAPSLDAGLMADLWLRCGPQAAGNHCGHAEAAEKALEKMISADMAELGETKETFRFFLVFAFEVMDTYGRLLCYINRNQPDATKPSPRPLWYNERLLQAGRVVPYFIWPNISPFNKALSVTKAVIKPNKAADLANGDSSLRQARAWVRAARQQQVGIFEAGNPLKLLPFEVRFLARRQPPDRWVIDLSKNDDLLIKPENYYTIPNVEDRLFIPSEYVPLFVENGWRRQP